MTTAIWLLFVLACLGAFDTLYYHEFKLRLPHGDSTATELRLHAARDFAYAGTFGTLAWVTWEGLLVWGLAALLLSEFVITMLDFVEEDRKRRLPPGERVSHAVMGIVYGAFLAFLVPEARGWLARPTGFGTAYHGFPGWVLSVLCAGVFVSGLRDLRASFPRRTAVA